MTFWNYGVYADPTHGTICYVASVRALTQREAIAALRLELKLIPMLLYIGPLRGSSLVEKVADENNIQTTHSDEVRLIRIDIYPPTQA